MRIGKTQGISRLTMKIDLLILQLAVVFLPGIIWAKLDAGYAAKIKPSDTEFFLRAFMFGIAAYAVEFLVFAWIGRRFVVFDLTDATSQNMVNADVAGEVLYGVVISLVLGILWIYAATYKIAARFLQLIGATKKYGDEDVWDFTFNSGRPEVEYIHFRDFDNQFVYSGWVNTFSETDKLRELVLRDVVVSDFDGNKLFELPFLYLARPPDKMHVEFPYLPPDEENEPSWRARMKGLAIWLWTALVGSSH